MNEAFESESLQQEPAEEMTVLQDRDCDRTSVQCVNISAAVTMEPVTALGTVTASCRGVPEVTCETNADGTACRVTMTQQICVSMPVHYSVDLTLDDPAIACAGDGTGLGCTCLR